MKFFRIDFSDIIAIAGAGLITWGIYEIFVPAAIIFGGIILIIIAVAKAKTGGE